jgi:hypothetical protein
MVAQAAYKENWYLESISYYNSVLQWKHFFIDTVLHLDYLMHFKQCIWQLNCNGSDIPTVHHSASDCKPQSWEQRDIKRSMKKRVKEWDSFVTSSMDSRKEYLGNWHHLICKIIYSDKQIKLLFIKSVNNTT